MGLDENAATTVENAGGSKDMDAPVPARPCVRGKFIFIGGEKFYVKGVTYGAFTPREDNEYHAPETIEKDFADGSEWNQHRSHPAHRAAKFTA